MYKVKSALARGTEIMNRLRSECSTFERWTDVAKADALLRALYDSKPPRRSTYDIEHRNIHCRYSKSEIVGTPRRNTNMTYHYTQGKWKECTELTCDPTKFYENVDGVWYEHTFSKTQHNEYPRKRIG